MRKIILFIVISLLPLLLTPMLKRKQANKDYLPFKSVLNYMSSYTENSKPIENFNKQLSELKSLSDDGYDFGDVIKSVGKTFLVIANVILIPFDFIIYYFNFIPFYINA